MPKNLLYVCSKQLHIKITFLKALSKSTFIICNLKCKLSFPKHKEFFHFCEYENTFLSIGKKKIIIFLLLNNKIIKLFRKFIAGGYSAIHQHLTLSVLKLLQKKANSQYAFT